MIREIFELSDNQTLVVLVKKVAAVLPETNDSLLGAPLTLAMRALSASSSSVNCC